MFEFILNDETEVNSYGFRILNEGIDLSRFKNNAVILDSHWDSNHNVIGRWENIRIEGSQLKAKAIFDIEDENVKRIAGKVERGFLKGASMGLLRPASEDFIVEASGSLVLVKSELMEASICAIPSNAKALKLYNNDRIALTGSEIKEICLSASSDSTHKEKEKQEIEKMNKIKLSVSAVMALGLSVDNTELEADVINAKILVLSADRDAVNEKLKSYEEIQKATQIKLATDMVEYAIKEGKIDATQREHFIALSASNASLAKSVLDGIPVKINLSTQINNPGAIGEVKTLDDFQKLDLSVQLEFRNTQPDAYKKLFN